MLRDKRFVPHFKKSIAAQQAAEPSRPDLAGYRREVQELHKLNVTMTHVLRALTRNYSIPMPPAPMYPGEMIGLEVAQQELDDLNADIKAAMGSASNPTA